MTNVRLQKARKLRTRRLCILTLTRIFLLTQGHPALFQKITTPVIGDFISKWLNSIKLSKRQDQGRRQISELPCVSIVLQCFVELIQLHSASFRPYSSQLEELTCQLFTPTITTSSSATPNIPVSQSEKDYARRLFVLLHVYALKPTSGKRWATAVQNVLDYLHQTADLVFRALIDDWVPMSGSRRTSSLLQESLGDEVADLSPRFLSLPAWTGIHAGVERLNELLDIAQAFFSTKSSMEVDVPIVDMLDVIDRILSAIGPNNEQSGRLRPEIGRYEREGLLLGLPSLHISAMHILSNMIETFGGTLLPAIYLMFPTILLIFKQEREDHSLRQACYILVAQILSLMGQNTPRKHVDGVSRLFQSCCDDLLPPDDHRTGIIVGQQSANSDSSPDHANSILQAAKTNAVSSTTTPEDRKLATKLLSEALTHLPNNYLPVHLRSLIDRTAIITGNKQVLLTSTMNPAKLQQMDGPSSSILPFLARECSQSVEVGALVKPQVPIVQAQPNFVNESDRDPHREESIRIPRPTHLNIHNVGEVEASGRLSNIVPFSSDKDNEDKALTSRDSLRFVPSAPTSPAQSPIRTIETLSALPQKRNREADNAAIGKVIWDTIEKESKKQRLEESFPESGEAGDQGDVNTDAMNGPSQWPAREDPSSDATELKANSEQALLQPLSQDRENGLQSEDESSDGGDSDIPSLDLGSLSDEESENEETEDDEDGEDEL